MCENIQGYQIRMLRKSCYYPMIAPFKHTSPFKQVQLSFTQNKVLNPNRNHLTCEKLLQILKGETKADKTANTASYSNRRHTESDKRD